MRKTQSALEYLFSYGWAILIIIIIGVVLYLSGIFNPRQNTSTQVSGLSYFHLDDSLINSEGSFFIELGLRIGEITTVTNVDYSVLGYDCINDDDESDVIISPDGVVYLVLFPDNVCGLIEGEMITMNVSIEYYKSSGIQHTDFGTITILVQPQDPLVFMNMTKLGPLIEDTSNQIQYTILYEAFEGSQSEDEEWQDYEYITNSTLDETSPQLVVGPNDYIYSVFQRWTNSASTPTSVYSGDYWDIFIINSTDNGETWSNATRITSNSLADVQPNIIYSSDGNLIAIFQEHDGNDYELFISNSTNGIDWSTPYAISDNSYGEGDATIEQTSGGTYYVIYEAAIPPDSDYECYLINSSDLITWSTPFALTNNSYNDYDPDILIHNDIFYLTWSPNEVSKQEIYYSKATDPYDLSEWDSNTVRLTDNNIHDFEPSLFINNDDEIFISYIRWYNDTGDTGRTTTEIMIAKSTLSDDSTWSTTRLTNNDLRDTYPGIIQDAQSFHHLFYGHYDGNNIRLAIQDLQLNPYDALRVTIHDQIPNGTTLVEDTITHGGIFDGENIDWEFTNIYAGSEGFVSFNVTIDESVTNGTFITNTAELRYYNWENRLANQINASITTLCIE